MRFENDFSVDAPIDEVFAALLDLERVAPAMPGAEVTERIGEDAYKVAIKVKLGPMTMNYRGDVEVRDRDAASHTATMHVKAREARGQGTATADVVMRLAEQDGATHTRIEADVQLAGRAAAMGRGLIEDVSRKLVDQFAGNLAQMLSDRTRADGAPSADGAEAASAAGAAAPPRSEAAASSGSDAASVDAVGIASGIAADRLRDPRVLGGALGAALLLGYVVGRRSG